ncbi:MAG: response regulator transcription factor [Bacteroidota bacterium]
MNLKKTVSAVIVDDEAGAREVLETLLSSFCPEVSIAASCESVDSALEAIKKHQPDIVFLDINMPSKDGFDLLNETPERTFRTIFTTAYDQYAVKAIKFSALDYLLKPIDIDELITAVRRAVDSRPSITQQLLLIEEQLKRTDERPDKIVLPTMSGFEMARLDKVVRLEADSNYVKFHFSDRKPLVVSKPLKHYVDLLEGPDFFRVHQSHMVNLLQISRYVKGASPYLIMSDGASVPIARNNKSDFTSLLFGGAIH